MFRKIALLLVAFTAVGVCSDYTPALRAAVETVVVGALSEGGPVLPDGTEIQCDLPMACRKRNIASKGLGCCVFMSMHHTGCYQNIPVIQDFAEWMVKKGIEGGGYPAKVDKLIAQIAKDRGEPVPEYVQHTGGDLEFLYAVQKSGRMACVTYAGMDMHYGPNKQVDHMVNLVHLDPPEKSPRMAAILDNNFVEENRLVRMTAEEFRKRWLARNGGWAIAFKAPRPPAPPRNG